MIVYITVSIFIINFSFLLLIFNLFLTLSSLEWNPLINKHLRTNFLFIHRLLK